MALECPKYPDWESLGVPPEPTREHETEFYNGCLIILPVYDPTFERDHRQWVQELSREHRAIYDTYLLDVKNWVEQGEMELQAIEAAEYEAHGLQYGVNTPLELQAARNHAKFFEMLDRIRTEAGGREANAQLENFFRRQSET